MVDEGRQSLVYEVVPAIGDTKGTVIWLHGLGADGHDFVPCVKSLRVRQTHGVRFVLPHAPRRRITMHQGGVTRAWFDVHALTVGGFQDHVGIAQSVALIQQLVEAEVQAGRRTDQMVLAGFSQGAAMAMYMGLRYMYPLAGILALSGCLPGCATLAEELHPANANTPILLAHGTDDPVLPLHFGLHAKENLEHIDAQLTWKTYPMAHQVCDAEMRDVDVWLRAVFSG